MVFTHRDAFPPSHPPMCSGGRDQRDEVFLMGRKRERNNDFFFWCSMEWEEKRGKWERQNGYFWFGMETGSP